MFLKVRKLTVISPAKLPKFTKTCFSRTKKLYWPRLIWPMHPVYIVCNITCWQRDTTES